MQVYSNELYHYGVPGMKWGVRRYQNADGSLKPGAKRKQTISTAKSQFKNGELTRKQYKAIKKEASEIRRKEDESAFLKKHPEYKGDDYYGYKGSKTGKISNITRLERAKQDAGSYKQRGLRSAAQILGGIGVYKATKMASDYVFDSGYETAGIILSAIGGMGSGYLVGSGAAGALNTISDYRQSKK